MPKELTLDSVLVRGDGGTLHSHIVFLSCHGGVDGDLVVRLVPVGQTQVKVLQLNVHMWQDELHAKRCRCFVWIRTTALKWNH